MTGEGRHPPLELRVRSTGEHPVVAIRVWLRGGSRAERAPGVAWSTGQLLTEGTQRRSWRGIAAGVERRGMTVEGFAAPEGHGVAIDALAVDWEEALTWAAELVHESVFPAGRCRWVCQMGAGELLGQLDQPEIRTTWAFLRQLYGDHPLGRPLRGSPEGLRRMDPAWCAAHHASARRWGTVLAVAGAVPEDRVLRGAEALFGAPSAGIGSLPPTPLPASSGPERQRVELPASNQAHLLMGHLTVPRADPDFFALELLSVVLGSGAGLSGRIPLRVREREGLAYDVRATCAAGAGSDRGRLVVHVATSPGRLRRAEAAVREELERLLDQGPTAGEVEDARRYLLGREPFRRETARQWAQLLCEAALWRQPWDEQSWVEDRLREVDRGALVAAARRNLRPEELLVTTGVPRKI